jgi:hypothetical protein
MGMWRATLNRGQVRFITDQYQTFSGTVYPGSAYEANFNIPQNALLASVQTAWGPMWSVNDLGLAVYDGTGIKRGESNQVNLPGLTGKRERVVLKTPAAGTYQARLMNTLGPVGTPQAVTGAVEVTRVEQSPLSDISTVSSASRAEIYQALRTFVMFAYGNKFRPSFTVTRSELAATLVLGGRAPQYMAGQPSFMDVRDRTTRIFIESVQAAPGGGFFPDAETGGFFHPDARMDRLTAAIVLVRAAGLKAEAEAGNAPLAILDVGQIPASLRGYVSVALARGLLTQQGMFFNPQGGLTRAELAHAMAVMNKLATE